MAGLGPTDLGPDRLGPDRHGPRPAWAQAELGPGRLGPKPFSAHNSLPNQEMNHPTFFFPCFPFLVFWDPSPGPPSLGTSLPWTSSSETPKMSLLFFLSPTQFFSLFSPPNVQCFGPGFEKHHPKSANIPKWMENSENAGIHKMTIERPKRTL